jgi:sRNA-binding regulator protein Hfq
MELKEKDTIKDVLLSIQEQNKPVDILLKSGKMYKGTILIVGHHCVSLKQRGDRSFFDAIIRLEDIATIEVQVRS